MRITPVQADVNVSADYPHRGIPAAAFQSGVGAAGKEIAQGAEDIGRLYERKAKQDADAESIFLQSQAELALQNQDAALKTTVTDGGEYLAARRKAFQEVMEATAAQAKNPGTQQLLRAHMQRSLVGWDRQALDYAVDLTKKSEIAQLDNTTANFNTMLSLTPVDDRANIARINGLKEAAIMARAPSLGLDVATKMAIAEGRKTTEEIAFRDSRENPVGFLQRADEYLLSPAFKRGIDGKSLEALKEQAKGLITQAMERQHAADKRRDDARAALLKQDTEALVNDFDKRATNAQTEEDRQAVLKDLDLRVELRQMPDVDARRIREHMTNPKPRPSDSALRSEVGLDVAGASPKTTMAKIDYLHDRFLAGQPGLNYDDAVRFKHDLRATLKAQTDEGQSEKMKVYNQAEQELRIWLGIRPGMIERMTENINTNDPITRLYAQGLTQLRTRSFPGIGQEDPLAVVNDLGPRLQRNAGVTKDQQAATIREIVSAPTRPALEQAYRSGQISKGQYLYDLRLFDQLDKLAPPPAPTGAPKVDVPKVDVPKVRPRL